MNATPSAQPLLYMLMAVVKEARSLRDEISVLDLPIADAAYFAKKLSGIEQRATQFIALCVHGERCH